MKAGNIILLPALALLCLQCKAGPTAPPAQDEPGPAPAKKDIILATTTSTQDSGLLDELVPMFEKKTGFVVKTIAVGSGQAMAMGKRGDADVLLVHSPEAEGTQREGEGGPPRPSSPATPQPQATPMQREEERRDLHFPSEEPPKYLSFLPNMISNFSPNRRRPPLPPCYEGKP